MNRKGTSSVPRVPLRTLPGLRRGFPVLLLLAFLLSPVAAALAAGHSPTGLSRSEGGVLVLSSFSPTLPWTDRMLDEIEAELAGRNRPVNLYVEFLDGPRLPDTLPDDALVAFLSAKYRAARPQAVIADGAPAIHLLARHGARIFGTLPPVVGIFPDFRDLGEAGSVAAVQVTTGPHIDQTVRMALGHWPKAGRLVIVSDDSGPSHHLAGIIRAAVARSDAPALAVEHLHDLSMEELEDRLHKLPRDSIVLYTHLWSDATGRQFRPDLVAGRLAQVSAAPLYVLFNPDIGSGAIGGFVNDSGAAGRIAIAAALDLLDGRRPAASAPGDHYSSHPVADWRQLRRWGLREAQLPPETEIRFRPPSLFEAYFVEALLALGFIALLGAGLLLTSALFVQRGRLAHALAEANNRLEDRVAERTRDIERALAGEQAARGRLRTFLDMATHEFKTPLAVIDSAVQMLEVLVDAKQEGVGSRLALIRRSARRIIDLVETCLAGERIDEELPIRKGPFQPATLIERVIERQRAQGVEILPADLADLPPRMVADPELLGIALDALLDNARRYAPAGEPVELAAWQDGDDLVIAVCDRGPGVPADEVERIFEKYYRGRQSQGSPGTGIGLSLVRTIAELHGGSVACRSRDGGGAMFVLTVPLASAMDPAEATKPATSADRLKIPG